MAWYCTSRAKRIAVGPAGRVFRRLKERGRRIRVRRMGGRRVV
jgi:hypothetical protein